MIVAVAARVIGAVHTVRAAAVRAAPVRAAPIAAAVTAAVAEPGWGAGVGVLGVRSVRPVARRKSRQL